MLAAERELLTTPEVAELLRVSERTVRTWTHTGILKAIRIGGRVLYRRGTLTALLEALESDGGAR